jgi:predicted CXXCH cytochrome family protein
MSSGRRELGGPRTPGARSAVRRLDPWRLGALISAGLVALTLVLVLQYYYFWPSIIGPKQPIPFSHHFHSTVKEVSCLFCHPEAIKTPRAGVPAVETCMLCHQRIAIHYPHIAELRQYYEQRRPVPWVRVTDVPEFVYFNHQVHVRSQFDCGKCHGDVASMDRVQLTHEFTMGFCVTCHRDENATVDCYACHR